MQRRGLADETFHQTFPITACIGSSWLRWWLGWLCLD
jgi:hypothetical protein